MDNISVAVRIRPLNAREKKRDAHAPWIWEENSIAQTTASGAMVKACTFTFDNVFGPEAPTSDIYDCVAEPIIQSAVEGVNATIFAYGQTSSGKTHTMKGSENSPGVLPLAVQQIFDHVNSATDRDFLIRVSYLEIYNEVLRDLVAEKPATLRIHEDAVRGVYVGGLTEEIVTSPEQVLEFMAKGEANRHVSATQMNDQSSRSHTLFRMMIESRARTASAAPAQSKLKAPRSSLAPPRRSASATRAVSTDAPGVVRVSQLNLVDLAGSERVAHTGAAGQRLREGGHINKSLLTLGNVIGKLADQSDGANGGHVPYRDSKLTRILQTCLGGNARTAVVCTVTPASCHVEESLSTLKFANRAKRIRNQPVSAANAAPAAEPVLAQRVNEVLDDKAMVRRCQREIDELRRRLAEGNVEVAEARISALSEERDGVQRQLEQLQADRMAKLNRLVAFINDAPTPPVPGADKSGRHIGARRRDTWGPKELEDAAALQREHDGDTIDLGAVLRAAHHEADALLVGSAATDSAVAAAAPARERDLDMYMLPQRVSNEVIALRVALAKAEDERAAAHVRAAAAAREADEAAATLRRQLAEQRSTVASAQRAASDAAAQRDTVTAELEQLTAAHGVLQQELQSSALAAAEATQAECDKLRVASAELAAERDALKSELRATQRDAKAAASKITSTERDFARLRERFAKLEVGHTRADPARAEPHTQQTTQQSTADDAATAASRAAGAERELAHAMTRIDELEADLARARSASETSVETEGALASLKADHAALSERCDKYRREAAANDDAQADAVARADALTAELVRVHEQLATLEAERDELQAQHGSLQRASEQAATAAADECAALQQRLAAAESAHAAAANQLQTQLATLRDKLAAAKAAARDEAQSQREARELLEAELEVQREYSVAYERQLELSGEQATTIDELQAVNRQQSERLSAATSLMEEMRQQCAAAEADGAEKARMLKQTKASEAQLRAKVATLGNEAAAHQQTIGELQSAAANDLAKLQRAAREVKKLRQALDKSNATASSERDRADAAELRAKELNTDCATAAMRLQLGATHETTATRLRERLEKQAKELAAAHDAADSAEQRLARMEADHAAVRQQLEMRADTLQQTASMLEEQLQERGNELATLLTRTNGGGRTNDDADASAAEAAKLRMVVAQLQQKVAALQSAPRPALADVTSSANTPAAGDGDAAKQVLKMAAQQEALQKELALAQEQYATLRASLPHNHQGAAKSSEFATLTRRAAELEVLLASERTRRLKVQAKLKQVVARVSGASVTAK